MYATGRGVGQDDGEAVRWFRRAAEQGHGPSLTALAGRYFNGQGVPPDMTEGVRWYRMAAEQGNPEVLEFLRTIATAPGAGNTDAQVALGEMHFSGRGVLWDPTEAVRWYRMAARESDIQAQIALPHPSDFRRAGPQDEPDNPPWFEKAGH